MPKQAPEHKWHLRRFSGKHKRITREECANAVQEYLKRGGKITLLVPGDEVKQANDYNAVFEFLSGR